MPVYFPTSAVSTLPNLFNFNPSGNLKNWKAAKARVYSGAGNAKILCVGDSTTLGVGASGSLTTGEMPAKAWPHQLAAALSTGGLTTNANSWFGGGAQTGTTGRPSTGPSRNVNDATWSFGTDWSYFNYLTLGGPYLSSAANTSNPFTYTPASSIDTFELYVPWQSGAGYGKIQYSVDSGSSTVFDENSGTSTFASKKIVISAGSLGTHTLKLAQNSGTCYVQGVVAYNSAQAEVSVINASFSGATVTDWTTDSGMLGTSSPFPFSSSSLMPDLAIVNLGINDWTGVESESLATYASRYQQILTTLLSTGSTDVVILTPNPSGTVTAGGETGIPVATQQQFINIMYGLARLNNVPLFDLFGRWGSYDGANSQTTSLAFNNYHPSASGYTDMGNFVSQALLTA